MNLCERIDEARERWNVLRHSFYTRWERGELTRDELGFYAGEYRHAVVALAGSAAAAGDAEHAREEAEHVALWDAFAAALEAPLDRKPAPETAACERAWSRHDRLEALAVLYAVESSQPAISETKFRGLVEHYGFRPDTDGTEYFALHAERDKEHAGAARAALADAAPAETTRLARVAEDALRANWLLLDGVEQAVA
jgi:pyrroloquinoline-quinone synthase